MISPPRISAAKRTQRAAGVASVMLAALTASHGARAADMPDESWLRGSYAPETPSYMRWDGVQFGVQVGLSNMSADFGNATSDQIAYILRNTTVESEYSPSSWTTLPNVTTNSRQYGAFLGYNWQWSEIVVGIDAAYNKVSNMEASASDSIARQVTTSDSTVHNVYIDSSASLKLVDYATVRGKAGYAFGQFLPYAMLGVAVGRFNYSTSATVRDVWTPSGGSATTFGPVTESETKNNAISAGFLVGVGLDVALLPNVFLRGEWEYVAFAPLNGIKSQLNTGRVGVGVRF